MKFRNLLAATAALSLAASPALAQNSVAIESAPVAQSESQLGGEAGGSSIILAILAAAAIIGAIIIAADGGDDEPISA